MRKKTDALLLSLTKGNSNRTKLQANRNDFVSRETAVTFFMHVWIHIALSSRPVYEKQFSALSRINDRNIIQSCSQQFLK